jgi:hypothetical protein
LPPAPHFVGRDRELDALHRLWKTNVRGVVALVGLGGAGKTAVAARFLEGVVSPDAMPRPDGLFVWSFYQEPDAGLFLQEAYHYFARGEGSATPAKGAGLLHLLREALAVGGPHLLVLDGLERVQQAGTSSTDVYGQLEDPLLKGLLTRIADGMGSTAVLVTSRFPLTDLHAFQGRGYRPVEVGGLEPSAARALLRGHGVKGDDTALGNLVEAYGAHVLTLDHLGSLIGQFLGGDPRRAPEAPVLTTPGSDRQALRLTRLLRAYEEHLPPAELALLCRLCLLRRSVGEDQIMQLFLCSPAVHARTVRELGRMNVSLPDPDDEDLKGFLLDLLGAVQTTVEESLCAAPIAGPEEAFRREIRLSLEWVLEVHGQSLDGDRPELARLYADSTLDVPTDLSPLPAEDRRPLRDLCARYVELRDHPLMPFQNPGALTDEAFEKLGEGNPVRGMPENLTTADVWEAFKRVRRRLQHLSYKHYTLRLVRELCRSYQRKWTLAGPLAPLDAAALHQVLESLVSRHLVLREADGSFSVHPAVRDHYSRVGAMPDQETWHEIIRRHLVSLILRPGKQLPEDAITLDLVEEAIYHALQGGRTEEALGLYNHVLGGVRHLAWKLGEVARGLRILRQFDPCPDCWALAWYHRALGNLEEAYAQNALPYFRADIRLLQGRLPHVAAEGDSVRTAIAAFLMGQTTTLPPQPLSCPIPRDQLLLYQGRLSHIRQSALFERFYHEIGWEGDRARCQLLLAEVARRQGEMTRCRQHLNAAAGWILHAGSVEHLCLLHLVRSRAARSAGESDAACRAVAEGVHLARQCGLRLCQVELLCEQAEQLLAAGNPAAAESAVREALELATSADCQFMWGAAEAGHLLGQILAAGNHCSEARAVLQEALATRRRLGDPRSEQTERLLARLGSAG